MNADIFMLFDCLLERENQETWGNGLGDGYGDGNGHGNGRGNGDGRGNGLGDDNNERSPVLLLLPIRTPSP